MFSTMVTVNPDHLYHLYHGAETRVPFPFPTANYVSRFQPSHRHHMAIAVVNSSRDCRLSFSVRSKFETFRFPP